MLSWLSSIAIHSSVMQSATAALKHFHKIQVSYFFFAECIFNITGTVFMFQQIYSSLAVML